MLTFLFVVLLFFLLLPTLLRWALRGFVWYAGRSVRKSERDFRDEVQRQRREQERRRYADSVGEYAEFEEVDSPAQAPSSEQFTAPEPHTAEEQISDAEFEEL